MGAILPPIMHLIILTAPIGSAPGASVETGNVKRENENMTGGCYVDSLSNALAALYTPNLLWLGIKNQARS